MIRGRFNFNQLDKKSDLELDNLFNSSLKRLNLNPYIICNDLSFFIHWI